MSDRRTIATMCAEISAEFAIFDYDELTAEYLKGGLDRPKRRRQAPMPMTIISTCAR